MKKFIATILAALMALSLAACGSSTATTETAAAAASGEGSSYLVQEGKLIMATNAEFPPYEYKDGDSFAGIDVEIATAIAEKLGLELQIEDVEFGSIIGGVQAGKYDIGMAGMTVTEERLESVNFSDSYATGIQSVIVPAGSDIKSIDDLTGKKIGVEESTTGDIYCCSDFGDENVVEYKNGADAVQALLAGKVDCVVIDDQPAQSYVAKQDAGVLEILDTAYAVEDYAIAMNKDNSELYEKVNGALKELQEDGTVDEIIAKYISE